MWMLSRKTEILVYVPKPITAVFSALLLCAYEQTDVLHLYWHCSHQTVGLTSFVSVR